VPSLRERTEDLLPLACQFLAFFAGAVGRPAQTLSPAAEATLLAYPWPGNVRELRNTMERAVILWPAPTIEPEAFPDRMQSPSTASARLGGDFTLEEIERRHILSVLARSPSVDEAARILGIDASTLWRKRKKYDAG
jgi:NtrC-family two-component system response regulator AlgB